jgi:adenosine deaminase
MYKTHLSLVPPAKRPSLEAIPKVELHRHLEGSLRLSTLRELAVASGMSVPADELRFKEHFVLSAPTSDLAAALNKFLLTQRLLSSEAILERVAFEAVEDAAREGIRILELRYAPTYVALGHPLLKWDAIHAAILAGLERARREIPTVATGLICIVQRTSPLREAESVTRFAIEHRDTFIGLDLADDEERFDCAPFARAFEAARAAGLKITVHAGEANYAGAARAVIDAVDRLGAMRIGHGVQVWRSEQAMEFIKSRRIPLELCPTSNWLTRAVPSLAAHPFVGLREEGVAVAICADDPGPFGIDLVNEYRVLSELHGLDAEDFTRINDLAAAASFIPFARRQEAWPRPIDRSLAPQG